MKSLLEFLAWPGALSLLLIAGGVALLRLLRRSPELTQERLPWAGAAAGAFLVLAAAWLRPVPPDSTFLAGRAALVLSQAITDNIPDPQLRRLLSLPVPRAGDPVASAREVEFAEASDAISRAVQALLPPGIRFCLLRFSDDAATLETLVNLNHARSPGRMPRPTEPDESATYFRRSPAVVETGGFLVVYLPTRIDRRAWLRLDFPKSLFDSSAAQGWSWILVAGLVLCGGAAGFRLARAELERMRAIEALSHTPGAPGSLEALRGGGELGERLVGVLTDMGVRSASVRATLADLKGSCERQTESVERLYQVSHEQSGGASSQAAAIQQVSTTAEEMAATARQISDNAARVTALAEETAQACTDGHTSVQDAIRGMEEVRRQVEAIAKRMTVLGANSSKIGGVTAIIDEISKQTNLLALNAAIEAAGAGEAGKRFGVVAVEVKRLADKTSNATKLIKELIQAIQEDTESTVRETEHGTESAMAGAQLVKAVGDALDLIGERVEQTTEAAREIRVSTGQQTHAASQMAGSLGQISDVSKQIEEGTHKAVGALVDLREASRDILEVVTRTGETL